ncbi:MAG: hypothetical protein ACXVZZ_12890 [Terriglobales bacterium]
MHSDDRQKLVALITAVLLAPGFDAGVAEQQEDLDHDPRIRGALRTARAICDAVEDVERRPQAVVFEPPKDVEDLAAMTYTGDEPPRIRD